MKTFGKIVLAAISLDSPSERPGLPTYLYPVALANAGPNTCSLRYASDAAYATFAAPDGLGFALGPEPPELPEELQPAAASPAQASAITPARRVLIRKVIIRTIATVVCSAQELLTFILGGWRSLSQLDLRRDSANVQVPALELSSARPRCFATARPHPPEPNNMVSGTRERSHVSQREHLMAARQTTGKSGRRAPAPAKATANTRAGKAAKPSSSAAGRSANTSRQIDQASTPSLVSRALAGAAAGRRGVVRWAGGGLSLATLIVSVLGLGDAAYLTYQHFSHATTFAGCAENGAINCQAVTTSA